MFSKKSMLLKNSAKHKSPASIRMAAIMVFGFNCCKSQVWFVVMG